MKTLGLIFLLLSSAAMAQNADVDIEVILFGSGNIDVGFTYDETANTAFGVNLATPMCAGGGTYTTVIQGLTPGTDQGLQLGGLTTWASGCEVAWDGYAVLTGAVPGGYPAMGGVDGSIIAVANSAAAVPEPPILALMCAAAILIGLRGYRRR